MYYKIEENKITVSPYDNLHRFIGALMIGAIVGGAGIVLSLWIKVTPEKRALMHFPSQYNVLLILGAFSCIYLLSFLYSRQQIIFDKLRQAMYRKTIFGIKELLRFEDVGAISEGNHHYGTGFKVTRKNDKYGEGFLISRGFALVWETKKGKDFSEKVLPAIKTMIAMTPPQPLPLEKTKPSSKLYESGVFTYFQRHSLGYELGGAPERKNKWKTRAPLLIFCGITIVVWCFYLVHGVDSFDDVTLMCVPLFPVAALLIASRFQGKIIFDMQEYAVKVFSPQGVRVYPLVDFKRFDIIRTRLNGLYTGTEVRMQFKDKELNLGTFKKSHEIEDFLEETKFIMNKK